MNIGLLNPDNHQGREQLITILEMRKVKCQEIK